ncbi:hypothetical cytosolic protein [Syntrophus aciditrophicus SB]|uniref:Hypothetical cytosolic protein n=1 Tax=Syntrophus aciditrophicus (strain SB) TaxID=56780 RepID=Q2LRV8_SYNAS|nr:hypothetical cytosolic protein [Syntrophus aciditrophicus SB]
MIPWFFHYHHLTFTVPGKNTGPYRPAVHATLTMKLGSGRLRSVTIFPKYFLTINLNNIILKLKMFMSSA